MHSGCYPRSIVTIEDCWSLLSQIVRPALDTEAVSLTGAVGRVLAEDLRSPADLPAFDHAAMDGYALGPALGPPTFEVLGSVEAGGSPIPLVGVGEAVRILTGAPLPIGTATVMQQENVTVSGDRIVVKKSSVNGLNIRRAGEDVSSGSRILAAGRSLTARDLALTAAVGFAELPVRRKLRIALASTGAELIAAGNIRSGSQVYDANGAMLSALLSSPATQVISYGILPDDPVALKAALSRMISEADLVVTSGGASVGDADYLRSTLLDLNGQLWVDQVAIRPGKPIRLGALGTTPVCLLPGNPFAAFCGAFLFVRYVAACLLGLGNPVRVLQSYATFSYKCHPHRTDLVPVRIEGASLPKISRSGPSGSARLRPIAEADGLALLGPAQREVQVGDLVRMVEL